jgi:hypothetical protein
MNQSNGIGVVGLLGVLFVALKLTHVINWSWWWVTAPFWMGFAIALAVIPLIAFTIITIEKSIVSD